MRRGSGQGRAELLDDCEDADGAEIGRGDAKPPTDRRKAVMSLTDISAGNYSITGWLSGQGGSWASQWWVSPGLNARRATVDLLHPLGPAMRPMCHGFS